MPRTHVPVLAGELIEALDPQPGQVVVDCTLGAAGHARLVADRIGPAGTLIAIDRDPLAEEAFAALAAEVPCQTRFLRADFEHGLATLAEEGLEADLVYMDLGMSSMQVDTRERGFSYSYDAPLDMRMDPEQELHRARDRQHVGAPPARARHPRVRRGALRRPHRRRRSSAPARSRPPSSSSTRSPPRSRRPARFAGGHPAKRTFQAIRIAVNEELAQLDAGAAARLEDPRARRPARRASRSTRSRTAASSASSPTASQGCICPPDLPVCGCGRTPEAELVFRRSVAPSAGEIAANPRSKSARLRAARKLKEEQH